MVREIDIKNKCLRNCFREVAIRELLLEINIREIAILLSEKVIKNDQSLNVLFILNVYFISCNIFNNSSCFFDFNPGYFFQAFLQNCSRRVSIFNKISALDMFSLFCCASASYFVIGIGLKREDGFLLINTSIIKFCRACFAKYIKFFNYSLNS